MFTSKKNYEELNRIKNKFELDLFVCLPDYSPCVQGTLAAW